MGLFEGFGGDLEVENGLKVEKIRFGDFNLILEFLNSDHRGQWAGRQDTTIVATAFNRNLGISDSD